MREKGNILGEEKNVEALRTEYGDDKNGVSSDAAATAPIPSFFSRVGRFICFNDYYILRRIPSESTLEQVYLVEKDGKHYILKIYGEKLSLDINALNAVKKLSRDRRDLFCAICDLGYDEKVFCWYEVQEYLPLGSLRDIPSRADQDGTFIKELVRFLAESVQVLHAQGIIHGSINPSNILLRFESPPDFVLSNIAIVPMVESRYSFARSSPYETLYSAPRQEGQLLIQQDDWWSVGVVVLDRILGALTARGDRVPSLFRLQALPNWRIPEQIAPEYQTLLKGLLSENVEERWGANEALKWCENEKRGVVEVQQTPLEKQPPSAQEELRTLFPTADSDAGENPAEDHNEKNVPVAVETKREPVPPAVVNSLPVERDKPEVEVVEKKQEPPKHFSDWPMDLQELLPVKSPSLMNSAVPAHEDGAAVFYFKDVPLNSLEAIARAFAEDELSWEQGREQLQKLQMWLENTGYVKEAQSLLDRISMGMDSDQILFYFVNENARLPFIYKGKQVNYRELYHCLEKMVTRSASPAERDLVQMLNDDKLTDYYNEYVRITSNKDSFLERLLGFLKGKPPSDQWVYLSALVNPAAYYWPQGVKHSNLNDILSLMEAMGTIPLNRGFIEEMEKHSNIPANIKVMLNEINHYSIGASHLRDLHAKNMAVGGNKEEENYLESDSVSKPQVDHGDMGEIGQHLERAASLFLGRSEAVAEEIESGVRLIETIVGDIGTELNAQEVFQLSRLSDYFRQLRERHFASEEADFVRTVAVINGKYESFIGNINVVRLLFLFIGGGMGALASLLFDPTPVFQALNALVLGISLTVFLKKIICYVLADDFEWIYNIGYAWLYIFLGLVSMPLAWWIVAKLAGMGNVGNTFNFVVVWGIVALAPLSEFYISQKKRALLRQLFTVCSGRVFPEPEEEAVKA